MSFVFFSEYTEIISLIRIITSVSVMDRQYNNSDILGCDAVSLGVSRRFERILSSSSTPERPKKMAPENVRR
jgi:hypothetical protein